MASRADRAAAWIAVALGLSIPVSTALDNLLVLALLLAWLAGGGYRDKAQAIRESPFALAATGFFLLAVAGSAYSAGGASEILYALDKAAVILLVPVLVSLRPDTLTRERALTAFLAAMTATLLLSLLIWLGWLPGGGLFKGSAGDAQVFKKHITQSVLMAFAAYALALRAREASRPRARALLWLLAALAAGNVLFMIQGRTGQLVLATLLVYALVRALRWRGAAFAMLTGAALAGVVQLMPSSTMSERVNVTIAEIEAWRAGEPANAGNLRPESWDNSVQIVRQHPLLGVGTGGFGAAYARLVEGTSMRPLTHPENQYLLTTVQLGAVGLVALLALFVAQWRLAARLATRGDTELARGLVIAMAVGCLFNSFLLDHTEAFFYAWLSGLLFAGRATGSPAPPAP